jgi:hypothetical protein
MTNASVATKANPTLLCSNATAQVIVLVVTAVHRIEGTGLPEHLGVNQECWSRSVLDRDHFVCN